MSESRSTPTSRSPSGGGADASTTSPAHAPVSSSASKDKFAKFDAQVHKEHHKQVLGGSKPPSEIDMSSSSTPSVAASEKDQKVTSFNRRRLIKRCAFTVLCTIGVVFLVIGAVILGLFEGKSAAVPPGQDPSHDKYDGTYAPDAKPQRASSPLFGLRASLGLASEEEIEQEESSHEGIQDLLQNVVDPREPYDPSTQVPFLWSPGAPNFVASEMLRCFPLSQASWLGREHEGMMDNQFEALPSTKPDDRGQMLDVDLSTLHGVKRAKELGLIESGMADFIASPFLPEILDLFPSSHRGRVFTILIDPIARVKQSYNYLIGQSIYTGSELEFVSSNHILANDYIVRSLSGKWDVSVPLIQHDFDVALNELRTKFHVGAMRYYKEFFASVIRIFGWTGTGAFNCLFGEEKERPPPKPLTEEIQIRSIAERHNTWDHKLLDAVADIWAHNGNAATSI